MSEVTTGEVPKSGGEGHAPVETVETLSEKLAQMQRTNERLLSESKENKTKAQLAKEELDKKEREGLEAKGNLKELIEKEREIHASKEASFTNFKKSAMTKFLEAEILKYAPDTQDVKLVKQSLPVDLINMVEQDDGISFTGVKEGIEQVKKDKPFLFKNVSVPNMVSGKPGAGGISNMKSSGSKGLNEMKTTDDIVAFWAANPHIK